MTTRQPGPTRWPAPRPTYEQDVAYMRERRQAAVNIARRAGRKEHHAEDGSWLMNPGEIWTLCDWRRTIRTRLSWIAAGIWTIAGIAALAFILGLTWGIGSAIDNLGQL